MEDSHQRNKQLVDAAKKANQERYEQHSKKQLNRHIDQKFKTTMIGALARFEKYFGSLWGYNKPNDVLTDEERRWKDIWEVTRTEVLNNGNNQMRSAGEEISNYTIKFNKFKTEFEIVVKPKE